VFQIEPPSTRVLPSLSTGGNTPSIAADAIRVSIRSEGFWGAGS